MPPRSKKTKASVATAATADAAVPVFLPEPAVPAVSNVAVVASAVPVSVPVSAPAPVAPVSPSSRLTLAPQPKRQLKKPKQQRQRLRRRVESSEEEDDCYGEEEQRSEEEDTEGSLADFIVHDSEEEIDDVSFEAKSESEESNSHDDDDDEDEDEGGECASAAETSTAAPDCAEEDSDEDIKRQYRAEMEHTEGTVFTNGVRRSMRASKGKAPVRYIDDDYAALMLEDTTAEELAELVRSDESDCATETDTENHAEEEEEEEESTTSEEELPPPPPPKRARQSVTAPGSARKRRVLTD